jgi:hypothetical protein
MSGILITVIMLNVTLFKCHYGEYYSANFHYYECHSFKCHYDECYYINSRYAESYSVLVSL